MSNFQDSPNIFPAQTEPVPIHSEQTESGNLQESHEDSLQHMSSIQPSTDRFEVNCLTHSRRDYPLTIAFALTILITYGVTTMSSNFTHISNQALQVGSFYPPLVFEGQWWRFISASLLHANPSHLLNNLFGVLVFGSLLEPVIGSWRLFTLYLFSGVLGLLFSAWFLPTAGTIGASTIDFGLMGAYFTSVLIQRYHHNRPVFAAQLRSAVFFIMFFVGWNLLEIDTVNLWAHMGGLLAGVIFALFSIKAFKKPL